MQHKGKILVVDDDPKTLTAMKEVLSDINTEVHLASSARSALEKAIRYDYALVICDVNMPEIGGYEFVELLKSNMNTKDIPVILVTGEDRSDTGVIEGIKSRAVDFIFKPINEDILIGKSRIFLDLYTKQKEICDSKELAEKLHKKANASSEAKTAFLGLVSHEIRTPLNGVIGFSDLLLSEEKNPEKHEMLLNIQRAGIGLLSLLNDILEIAKIETGKTELAKVPFNFKQTLESIHDLFKDEAKKKGIYLKIDLSEVDSFGILGDEKRLKQILFNLIGNSIKFTNEGGVTLKVKYEHQRLWMKISDTGIGMEADQVQSVLEPFVQAEAFMTRTFGGLGLGLSIVKHIVDMWHGTLSLQSEPGKGCHIEIEIPTPSAKEKPNKRQARPINDLCKDREFKILVCEDNLINQNLVKGLLQREGCIVHVEDNGQRGVEAFKNGNFDIILMDIMMPIMDGSKAVREIRKYEKDLEETAIPIVALTAISEHSEIEKLLRSGFDSYCPKPLRKETIMSLLSEHLTTNNNASKNKSPQKDF